MPVPQLDLQAFRARASHRPVFEEGRGGRPMRVLIDARLLEVPVAPEVLLL
jgi:hypothetical protein